MKHRQHRDVRISARREWPTSCCRPTPGVAPPHVADLQGCENLESGNPVLRPVLPALGPVSVSTGGLRTLRPILFTTWRKSPHFEAV